MKFTYQKKKKITINIYTMIFNKFIIVSYKKKKKKVRPRKFLLKQFITFLKIKIKSGGEKFVFSYLNFEKIHFYK